MKERFLIFFSPERPGKMDDRNPQDRPGYLPPEGSREDKTSDVEREEGELDTAEDGVDSAKEAYDTFVEGVDGKLEDDIEAIDDSRGARVREALENRGDEVNKKLAELSPEAVEFEKQFEAAGTRLGDVIVNKAAMGLLGKTKEEARDMGYDDKIREILEAIDVKRTEAAEALVIGEDDIKKEELRTAAETQKAESAEKVALDEARAQLEEHSEARAEEAEAEAERLEAAHDEDQRELERIEGELEDVQEDGLDHDSVIEEKGSVRAGRLNGATSPEPVQPPSVEEPEEQEEEAPIEEGGLLGYSSERAGEADLSSSSERNFGPNREFSKVEDATYEVGDGEANIASTSRDVHTLLIEEGVSEDIAARILITDVTAPGATPDTGVWNPSKKQ